MFCLTCEEFRIKDPTFARSLSHEKFFSGIKVLKGDQFSKPAEESKRILHFIQKHPRRNVKKWMVYVAAGLKEKRLKGMLPKRD